MVLCNLYPLLKKVDVMAIQDAFLHVWVPVDQISLLAIEVKRR